MVGQLFAAVRDHRHRRAARLAARVADRDPGAGVLVPAARRRRRRRGRRCAARPRRRSCAARCSARTCRSCGSPRSAAAGSPCGIGVVVFVGHVRPGDRPEDQLPRPVRAGHAHAHPGAAGGHQPGRHRRGGQEGRGGAGAAPTASRPTRSPSAAAGSPVRRAAAATARASYSVTLDEDADAVGGAGRRCATSSTASPDAGEITVGGGGGGGFDRRPARRSIVQAADPDAPDRGDRAGARGDGRHARTSPT